MLDTAYPEIDLGGEKLRDLQLERLKWTLDHAYRNNAHYSAAFDRLGVKPSDLRSLDDLARFPFMTKASFRSTYPFGLFAVPKADIARLHASSGTTGKPVVVGYTSARSRHLGEPGRALDPRRRRPAGHDRCTWPTATASSPAASARTTAPSASAAPWFP